MPWLYVFFQPSLSYFHLTIALLFHMSEVNSSYVVLQVLFFNYTISSKDINQSSIPVHSFNEHLLSANYRLIAVDAEIKDTVSVFMLLSVREVTAHL